jgi:hypothetical protein
MSGEALARHDPTRAVRAWLAVAAVDLAAVGSWAGMTTRRARTGSGVGTRGSWSTVAEPLARPARSGEARATVARP